MPMNLNVQAIRKTAAKISRATRIATVCAIGAAPCYADAAKPGIDARSGLM
jgi:hypothetical protein